MAIFWTNLLNKASSRSIKYSHRLLCALEPADSNGYGLKLAVSCIFFPTLIPLVGLFFCSKGTEQRIQYMPRDSWRLFDSHDGILNGIHTCLGMMGALHVSPSNASPPCSWGTDGWRERTKDAGLHAVTSKGEERRVTLCSFEGMKRVERYSLEQLRN